MKFQLAMSMKELKMRTSRIHYKPIKLLSGNSREVKNLTKNDLLVLMHLCRAAQQIDMVHYQLENHHNLEFLSFLNEETEKKNQRAELSRRLFLSQKSMFSFDNLGKDTKLVKNLERPIGMGFYPEDLSVREFHKILFHMLENDMGGEVQKILSQRTVVVRDGDILKAIDYVDKFKMEFSLAAKELRLAQEHCDDQKFNKFLEL